jgi:hypothetical protein
MTLTVWRGAIAASVVLWVATLAGNFALFAVHPARHWPVLESVETLQVASLIPVALLLHRLNGGSSLSRLFTTIGMGALLALTAIDVGFVTERVTYSKGPLGGPGFYVAWVVVLGWLLGANAVAWRRHTLPRGLAVLGVVTAATAMLLYPTWAVGLLRVIQTGEMGLEWVWETSER